MLRIKTKEIIDEQLVKEEQMKMIPWPRPFDTFNANRTRSGNHRVAQFALLKLEINRHMENINIVVTNLNDMDIFLEYN